MSLINRRLVSFAGSTIAIEWCDARAAALVDFLYRHVPADQAQVPEATWRVANDAAGEWQLYRDATLVYTGLSEARLAELLLGDTCHHLADRSREGLLFHAAGLAWQGRGLLMPGGAGAGKTTLTAWLASRGLTYLTDELVFVPHGGESMRAFTRPLHLKSPSRAVLRGHLDLSPSALILSDPQFDLIAPELWTRAPDRPDVNLILFPRYSPTDSGWHVLSKARAGLRLMECLVNARSLSRGGLPQVARLVENTPAYLLCYASFDQLGERIKALLSA